MRMHTRWHLDLCPKETRERDTGGASLLYVGGKKISVIVEEKRLSGPRQMRLSQKRKF